MTLLFIFLRLVLAFNVSFTNTRSDRKKASAHKRAVEKNIKTRTCQKKHAILFAIDRDFSVVSVEDATQMSELNVMMAGAKKTRYFIHIVETEPDGRK